MINKKGNGVNLYGSNCHYINVFSLEDDEFSFGIQSYFKIINQLYNKKAPTLREQSESL